MIIELIGLPGAGKTTFKLVMLQTSQYTILAQQYVVLPERLSIFQTQVIQRLFTKKNGKVNSIASFFMNYLTRKRLNRFLTKNHSLKMLLSSLVQSSELVECEKVVMAMESYLTFERALKLNRTVVFDEGPAQRGITYARNMAVLDKYEISSYYEHCPKPDILIVLNISPELAKERVVLRDGSQSHLIKYQDKMSAAVEICRDEYKRAGVVVIDMAGNESFKQAYAQKLLPKLSLI